jgi:hypothetical protein
VCAHTAIINCSVTECSNDVEMHETESQLAEDEATRESKERCAMMEEEEGACPQGEGGTTDQGEMSQDGEEKYAFVAGSDEGGVEGKGKTADEEEDMSQDEGDTIQNQQEDVVAAGNGEPGDEGGEHGGEGKIEATGKEEQPPAEEGEMSQDEDVPKLKETEPADADGSNGRVDDMGRTGETAGDGGETAGDGQVDEEGRAKERGGADKGAKVEEMASQGSTSDSDSDSDSETYQFPDTLKEFKYHFKDGMYNRCSV